LRTYFGSRDVAARSPRQALRARRQADTLLVGLPTSLTGEELRALADRTRCRRVAVFDYLDQHELAWTPEQEVVLRGMTNRYLKPWFEPAWDFGLQMGLLPIRRYHRFSEALALDRGLRRFGLRPRPRYDVAFVGRPNYTRFYVDGQVVGVDQRVQWLRDIARDAPQLNLWGGLVEVTARERDRLEERYGDLAPLMYQSDKVGFAKYYRALRQSRVLLAPGGNVPWTYRHYECLYAGGVVLTLDYRQRDMLIPLPRDNMVHVPDGASVVPAVHEALELGRTRPDLGEQNFAHLERYLRYGAYSRRRPALLERFMSQFQ
jgi:hypothetical protein